MTRLLAAAISLIILGIVFRRLDLASLGHALLHLKMLWWVGALLLFGLAIAFSAWRWHFMLRLIGCTVHSQATLRTALIGHFFNTLLFGPAGGDIAKSILYSRWYKQRMLDVLTACLLDRLLGLGGLVLFAALALSLALLRHAFSVLSRLHLALSHHALLLVCLVCAGFAATAFIVRLRRPNSFGAQVLNSLFDGLSRLIRFPRLALPALGLSFLAHAGISGVLALSLQSTRALPLSWASILWTFPVISILASVPVTFAGSGVREGASLVLLGLYGISATDAVAASLLTFAAQIFWAFVGGILWWHEQKLLKREVQWDPPQKISVVIPTLNEAPSLPETIAHLSRVQEIGEIIVVDGGSLDGTFEIAQSLGCRTLSTARGRGGQLRAGAKEATGEVILLLHADTWLPPEAAKAMFDCLRDRTVVGGGFWKVFRERSWLMMGSRFRCALRLYFCHRLAGDQAIFMRRQALVAIDGVPDMPLMEEFELCRRLGKIGRLGLAGATVRTSGRRFRQRGTIRTYLRMWRVSVQYRLGASPKELLRLYEKD